MPSPSSTLSRVVKRPLSRRAFLKRAAVASAVGGVGATVLGRSAAFAAGRSALAEAEGARLSSGPGLHLLRRATFGPTPRLLAEMRAMDRTAWLEAQLAPTSIADAACDDLMATRFPRLAWSIPEATAGLEEFSWDLMFDLGVATLARAAWSKRQLLEVMVDFWSNHLNVTNPSDSVWATRHDYDANVIRRYALGRFEDMLIASATHPAMATYLNNAESSKDDPNENYGRELLELHTVGVDAGYSEQDMLNSVLVMTGFGVNWDTGLFKYKAYDHFVGPVRVMDWSSPNATASGGYQVGIDYLKYLANHPSTATRIASKLCARFVSDTPPASLVDALAQTYLASGTDVVPVLRQLFASTEFAGSLGAKVRRPAEDVVATIRTLGIKPDATGKQGMRGLYWMVESLGNAPAAWQQPNGYPDTADAWRSAGGSLGRWNTHMSLAGHWWPKQLRLPPLRGLLPKTLPDTYGEFVQSLAKRLLFQKLPMNQRDAVLKFLQKTPGATLRATDEAMRWRLPHLVALILDSPLHQMR